MTLTDTVQGYDVDGKKDLSAAEALRYVAAGGEVSEEHKESLSKWLRGMGSYKKDLFKDTELSNLRQRGYL
jgi:hypothetical protein